MSKRTIPFYQRLTCTPREAEEASGIGLTTLYKHMNVSGTEPPRLKSTKVDGKRLILISSLKELVGLVDLEAAAQSSPEMAA